MADGRRVRAAPLVAVSLLLLAGCMRGTSPEERSDDEMVWTLAGAELGTYEAIAELWNEQDPDTRVRIEALPDDADGQRIQLGLDLNAEGGAFDILSLDVIWTGEFANNGWIESLEDLRPQAEDAILPGPLETAMWEDELWAMPLNSGAGLLFWRTDLLDEAPETWEEAVEVATEAAEQEGIYPFVGQGASYEGLTVNYLEYVWAAGGDVLGEDGQSVELGEDDAAQTALQFMRDAEANGFYAPGFNTMMEDQANTQFASGNAVLMRNWTPFYAALGDPEESEVVDNFDVAPLPTFGEDVNSTGLAGFNVAVSAYSEHKEAALEFVEFVSLDPEAQATLAEDAIAPVLEETYEEFADDPVLGLLGDILPDANSRPPVPAYNDISVAIYSDVFAAYTGQQEVEPTVTGVRDEIARILEQRQVGEQ